MAIKSFKLQIREMTCEHCAQTIAKKLTKLGVIETKISYAQSGGTITFDSQKIKEKEIIETIQAIGPYQVLNFREQQTLPSIQKHLIIIGGGSAAFAATLQAHEMGAKITMVNAGLPIGGTCVNVGCVPSKFLIRAAQELFQARINRFAGIQKSVKLSDFKALIQQKQELIKTLQQQKYINVVKDLPNFKLIQGRATIITSNEIEVNGQKISGDALVIATGASPAIPSIAGLNRIAYLTNETLYNLEQLPEHLIIIGANFIGLEAAQMFVRFGSKVTVVERLPQILVNENSEIVNELTRHLTNEGIKFITSAKIDLLHKDNGQIILTVKQNGHSIQVNGSHLLIAAGRKGNTNHLTRTPLSFSTTTTGFLKVDEYLQTSIPGIFAAGDVIGDPMFVYTAAMEGKLAAFNALSKKKQKVDYSIVPWVIFTDPQVAGVGHDQKSALNAGFSAQTITLSIRHIPRFMVNGDSRGFIQLTRDTTTDRLLGARVLATEGSELIMELAIALKYGLTINDLKELLHPYLTAAEGIKLAAISFEKDVEQLSCCAT